MNLTLKSLSYEKVATRTQILSLNMVWVNKNILNKEITFL